MNCAACGLTGIPQVSIGGVLLCRNACAEDVTAEIARQRAEGKRPSASGIAREIYRAHHPESGDYLIRDVPSDLWNKAKHRGIDDGVSLRQVILSALDEYLNKSV